MDYISTSMSDNVVYSRYCTVILIRVLQWHTFKSVLLFAIVLRGLFIIFIALIYSSPIVLLIGFMMRRKFLTVVNK